ncbi:MAG: T9SS type A sorting domain-containing protein, partial [Pelagibacterales bacterium]|nr:T9SS type A sorting domain-containing protein [Pelagibacterales bacterium]
GVVCWESCGPCGGGPPAYNVTFQVDMTGVTGFTTPEVNGTFNGWCGNCWAMSDANGDSIWDFTTILAPGFYEYKFSADNWNIQEVLDSNLSCVLTTIDSLGNVFVNRLVDVISDTALDVVQWNGCASATVLGCTDSLACNYYSLATLDDGSCLTIYGCTNPFACNYDSLATCDDGSCLTIYGCMNPAAINYDSLANCPDSCIFPQAPYGCTDSTALNYNPLAIIDDSSCIYCIYGCTDILACNYDSTAQCDDGSCLTVYGCTDSLAYNFDSLATCDDNSCLYEYNVTFQLDLRGLTSILYTTPEINGIFNGWCGNCAQMTDVNNDSIWELTIPILEGSGSSGAPGWQYKFSADDWNIEENLFSGDPCTFTSSGYTNRYINVTQDTILDPVCWESCVDCFGPQSSYSVTFQVDMTNVFGFSVPEVNGEFNGWCGNCWPMTDVNGDDIWEFTATIDTSLQEYKFSADNWSIQEQLDSSMSCVFSTIDSSGNVYVNRYLSINSDTILDVICWEECTDCFIMQPSWDCNGQGDCINPGTGLGLYLDSLACTLNCQTTQLIEMKNNYIIYPNPTSEFIYINSKENIDNIIIYNKIGEIIFQIDNPLNMAEINFSGKSSDIYFMEIYNGTNVYREKVIYTQ